MDRNDVKFMKEAIRLAVKGLGRTSPNPVVGAVIVRNGRVIASGYHKKAGQNHAEIEALSMIGGKGEADDILYVTLEPCNHYGRTPPCTEAIIRSGIRNVVVGMPDPNPKVKGGGIGFLRHNGVNVVSGVLEAECRSLNEIFIKFITTGRPFVIAKSALTLDGWSAASTGHSKWITNERSRDFVHRLRDASDAIMTGVGTIISDDPSLTARPKNRRGRDPVRIIVDTHLRIPHNAKVLNHNSDAETILATGEGATPALLKDIDRPGVSMVICPIKDGRIDLNALMDILGKRSITSLLLEGGAGVMGSMIKEKLIDKFHIFKAPKILGGDDGIPMARGKGPERMDQSISLRDTAVKRFGEDILITGYPEYEPKTQGTRSRAQGKKTLDRT
ncbi:MAG: bifunctional diaminohydroxyphosphoribosylaminopyrimidine deaminase/5-amino-6-(5-phosphoribosylamino)uracil reductase RibD [Deltaproteobacteria bacterium]|nr:bifunctional diaminohydroxyphosphoribosylaminopyrimidine deaminase/5-amino-6-(5-phosphoribosylamino)uracil reductase RibD [Deltaproteobacteria bacterium]